MHAPAYQYDLRPANSTKYGAEKKYYPLDTIKWKSETAEESRVRVGNEMRLHLLSVMQGRICHEHIARDNWLGRLRV